MQDLDDQKLKALELQVKHYYRHVENYDWTRATDRFIGLETLFHWVRSREILKLVKRVDKCGHCLDIGCGTALITRHIYLRWARR